MNPFGDGSDGALYVTSGTTNLQLDRKYQYTDVVVSSGATLSTNSTTGAVLYILATNSIVINGAINVSNKVINGHNTWSYTADGVTYTSPGVAAGGIGGSYSDQTAAVASNGFGGGGGGLSLTSAPGGNGGNGSSTAGVGGAPVSTTVSINQDVYTPGTSGSGSSGGSGTTHARHTRTSGDRTGNVFSGNSGAGGSAYGNSGADGGVGYFYNLGGSGTSTYEAYAGGGGGAGGQAGKSGVHIVLKAPTITLNGQIITAGTNGQSGGNGGRSHRGGVGYINHYAMGGGGGGAGRGGNVSIVYSKEFTDISTKNLTGGTGGSGGIGYTDQSQQASFGANGTSGSISSSQIAAIANFSATPTSGMNDLTVTFTNLSQGGDSYLWNFGDGATSTSTTPSHVYNDPGTYTVSLVATNEVGSDTETKTNYITVSLREYQRSASGGGPVASTASITIEKSFYNITNGGTGGGSIYVSTKFQALPQKDYEYRVFDEDWNYIATWKNPTSEFSFSQRLNENASEMQITLARSPDNRVVKLDALKDHLGANITDENGDNILVQTETANSVGPDTDVRENLNVEIYAFYGGYEPLIDENGEEILDTTGDVIISQYGAPNGKRVYSGYIADYELIYGENTGVNVVLVPHATSLSHHVFYDGTATTVEYLNTDPVLMARDAMDDYISQGGYIGYTTETMPLSGESVDYDFKLQRTREVIDKTVDLLPADFYQYADPGENLQYVKQLGTSANHTFYYEKHISSLRLRKSITRLINDVHFTGGEISPGVDLYVHRQDTASKTSLRPGLEIISDSRVTQIDSAQILSDRQIEEFKEARWRTTVEITDAVYDIELIKLGHIVGFKNFGTFADDLLLPVVGFEKKKHSIILDLDMAIPSEAKRLEELKKQILNEQVRNIGAIPA